MVPVAVQPAFGWQSVSDRSLSLSYMLGGFILAQRFQTLALGKRRVAELLRNSKPVSDYRHSFS